MPRGQRADLFGSLRTQAAGVLKQLEDQIHKLETELADLKSHGEAWRAAVGGKLSSSLGIKRGPGRPPGRPVGSGKGRPKGSARVSWDEVLASVPKRFGVLDVMKHPGAAAKGRAQVYPALNRWEATKRIKRVDKGTYEKLGGGASEGATAKTTRGPGKKRAAAKKAPTGKKRGRPAKAKVAEANAS